MGKSNASQSNASQPDSDRSNSASKSNDKNLMDMLLDPKYIEALTKSITPTIIAELEKRYEGKLAAIENTLENYKKSNDELVRRVNDLESINNDLSCEVKHMNEAFERMHVHKVGLNKKIDDIETYTKRENLIIHGLQCSSYADAATVPSAQNAMNIESSQTVCRAVVEFCVGTLRVDVTLADISTAHRLPTKRMPNRINASGHVIPPPSPPIMVRFANRRSRDAVYNARLSLRNAQHRIYINEHLSDAALAIYNSLRGLRKDKKIHSFWSRNGNVYYKKTNSDQEVPTHVRDISEVQSI